MNIHSVSQISPTTSVVPSSSGISELASSDSPSSFADVMVDVVRATNEELKGADAAVADFEAGKTEDLNSVVMATAKADLSFRFLLEMRNRLTESYQELSRMQF